MSESSLGEFQRVTETPIRWRKQSLSVKYLAVLHLGVDAQLLQPPLVARLAFSEKLPDQRQFTQSARNTQLLPRQRRADTQLQFHPPDTMGSARGPPALQFIEARQSLQ